MQRVALPNWSDSAHELTIWERRPQLPFSSAVNGAAARQTETLSVVDNQHAAGDGAAESTAPASLLLAECTACGVPATGTAADPPAAQPLRRCRHCRTAAFCSKACRMAGGGRHTDIHALRLLFSERKLRFKSDADFEPLRLC